MFTIKFFVSCSVLGVCVCVHVGGNVSSYKRRHFDSRKRIFLNEEVKIYIVHCSTKLAAKSVINRTMKVVKGNIERKIAAT